MYFSHGVELAKIIANGRCQKPHVRHLIGSTREKDVLVSQKTIPSAWKMANIMQ